MSVPDDTERFAATEEPDSQVLLRQNWHHLLFLHWEIPPQELQALVPAGLKIDTFDGKAYAGLVPFTMTGVRPILTPPLPWVSSFHEVNVRTYVHHDGRHPGVWFFSLDASSTIVVAAARAAYHLPYFLSHIDWSVSSDAVPRIDLRSHRNDPRGLRPANAHIRYSPMEGIVNTATPGTLEFFLVERYILYAVDHSHQLYRAHVHHQPYPLQRADLLELDETLVRAAGIKRPEGAPLRHYASEVNVKVYGLEKV